MTNRLVPFIILHSVKSSIVLVVIILTSLNLKLVYHRGCEEIEPEVKSVDELKKQLREKEMVLTDIRLEALTSAHQLESLKETVNKMRVRINNVFIISLNYDLTRNHTLITFVLLFLE